MWHRLLCVHGGHRQKSCRSGEWGEGEERRGVTMRPETAGVSQKVSLCPLSSLPAGILCTPISISQVMSANIDRPVSIVACFGRTTVTPVNSRTFPTLATSLNPREIAGVPYDALVSELANSPNIWCKYRHRQDHLCNGAGSVVGPLGS